MPVMTGILAASGLLLGIIESNVQASDLIPITAEVQTGALRIVLMLKSDVGIGMGRPMNPNLLSWLSLKTGVDLVWEGNTRTNGQILALPIGITAEQARRAAEQLRLEPGILWADVEAAPVVAPTALKSQNDPGHEQTITRFIVKFRDDNLFQTLNPALVQKLISVTGLKLSVTGRTTLARILALEASVPVAEAERLEKVMESIPEVIYADSERRVDPQRQSEITPNDPLFWKNWHLQGPYALANGDPNDYNGYLGAANVQAAWALTKGKPSVAVAVLDTGILFEHPDLKRTLGRQTKKRGWDMVTDIQAARDGNARDPDAQDQGDWGDAGTPCAWEESPSSWHGSHVAGIIAATTNNGTGISGVNWKTRIVPVRVLSACSAWADVIDGVLWASGKKGVPGTRPNPTPLKIINLSLGREGKCDDSTQETIDYALAQDVSVVAAAGNYSVNVSYFAFGNCRGVISVAAVNHFGDKAEYSNYGTGITIAAPGGQTRWPVYDEDGKQSGWKDLNQWGIWSTVNSSLTTPDLGEMTYQPYQGTSMAAPVVSGVISLMVGVDKQHKLTPALVSKILRETARPFPPYVPTLQEVGWAPVPSVCTTTLAGQCGAGIIDAKAAVEAVIGLQ